VVLLVHEKAGGASELKVEECAQHQSDSALVVGAFLKHRSGTRLFSLQGREFFAFTFPHARTCQVGVWRQLGDVVTAGYGTVAETAPCRLRLLDAGGESLAPGKAGKRVGPLADLYSQRPYDREAWVYWECFWAPVGPDVRALQQGRASASFKPLMTPDLLADSRLLPEEVVDPFNLLARVPKDRPRVPDMAQAPPAKDAHAAVSKSEAFTMIYRDAVWPGINSPSGPGSDPFHPMVRIALSALDMVVDAFEVRSILDAACGDAGWITSHFLARRPGLRYVGVDIVQHVVEENRRHHPAHRFLAIDLGNAKLGEALPPSDLVFSKETLNHMYVQDAVHALQHFQTTGARYFLANITRGSPNYLGARKAGHQNYVQYDFALPPFNLRKLCRLIDCNQEDWTEFALFALQPEPGRPCRG